MGYDDAHISVPYFMNGSAQMKKVKEEKKNEKELNKIANTSKWGKKRKKLTHFLCEQCGNKSCSSLKEVIQEKLCLKCRTIKEKERMNMPKGKFLCGLYGCTNLVSSAHQAKHALEEHDMDIRKYKDARKAMKKGNRGMVVATGPAAKEPPTPAPSLDKKIEKSNIEPPEQQEKTPESMSNQEIMKISGKTELNGCRISPEEFVGIPVKYEGVVVGKCLAAHSTDDEGVIEMDYEITDKEIMSDVKYGFMKGWSITDNSIEMHKGIKPINEPACPEPIITEESIKTVQRKNEVENKLKAHAQNEIDAQNEKHTAKEIIKVIILRCPHCGGNLKMKE